MGPTRAHLDESLAHYCRNADRLNTTLLQDHNLIYYEGNNTLSNHSVCYHIPTPQADSSAPACTLYANGTISPTPNLCSDPVLSIQLHSKLGILFGCLFLIPVLLALANLHRVNHDYEEPVWRGQRTAKRRGRRQYYLILLTSAIGMMTCFISIDVDREAVTGPTFELQSIFYSLLLPLLQISLYESVDFWTWSFRNNYRTMEDARESSSMSDVLWMFLFYALILLAIGLIEIRNWNALTKQWYSLQAEKIAKQAGTDTRFRAGYLIMLFCNFVFVARLALAWRQHRKLTKDMPSMAYRDSLICLTGGTCLTSLTATYLAASSYTWGISPYNGAVHQAWYYVFGPNTTLVVLTLLNWTGAWTSSRELSHRITSTRSVVRRRGSQKPFWWWHARFKKADSVCDHMNLDDIGSIRGREEDDRSANVLLWWQKDNDDDDKPSASTKRMDDTDEPHIAIITAGKYNLAKLGKLDTVDIGEPNSSSSSKPVLRYKSPLGQNMAVRSLLDA